MSNNNYDVSGKVALVTGGASGIGAETARLLARNGAAVVVADINGAGGGEVVAAIEAAGGRAVFADLDVTSETAWDAAVGLAVERFGGLHIVLNGAGIEITAKISDTSLENFHKIMAVNVDGVFLGIKHTMPVIRDSGGGSIINISSIAGIRGYTRQIAYAGSKGAVRMMTKAAAEAAYYGFNVRVNSVHPGAIDTPMVQGMMAHHDGEKQKVVMEKMRRMHPLGRLTSPTPSCSWLPMLPVS
ncbi:MAG: SDR family NAD(P)-dependent oxidoreductase [Alphaproteobacteria bacterium]